MTADAAVMTVVKRWLRLFTMASIEKKIVIYYIKSVVENERDEISKLREMEKENQIKKDEMIAEIVKQFERYRQWDC